MSKDEIVMVRWVDSLRNSAWDKRSVHESMVASECTSVGYLLKDGEEDIIIYQSIDPDTNSVGCSLTIPKVAVREVIKLRRK